MRPERAYSPAARATEAPDPSRVLVIACGALARELVAVVDQAGLANVDLTCLPATLHNRPGGIPELVRSRIRAARPRYEHVFVAYADCGTGGLLDRALEEEGVDRLPGAHCYEFFSGSAAFAAITDDDPATFFLTDFLARNFDRLVIQGLGLDRHPELLPTYFGNYHRLVYLAQTDDPGLVRAARRAARRLGLTFEMRQTGYGDMGTSLVRAAALGGSRQARGLPEEASERPGAESFAPDATPAPGARSGAAEPPSDPKPVDVLHPGQANRPSGHSPAKCMPPTHDSRPVKARTRGYVHPAQDLHGLQRASRGQHRASRRLHPAQEAGKNARGSAWRGSTVGASRGALIGRSRPADQPRPS